MGRFTIITLGFLAALACSTFAAPADRSEETATDRRVTTQSEAEEYLRLYYGLGRTDDGSPASLLSPDQLRDSIRTFQRYAGLQQTGELDAVTLERMNDPRCGVPDVTGSDVRVKRFATEGSRWQSNYLTYRILNFSPDMDQTTQVSEIARAFNVWSEQTPLSFTRVFGTSPADIEISFGTYNHGDSFPFDGPGGVLAHAFFPRYGGDVHMDDSESYTAFSYTGTNFFQVMAHEIGHSLGLEHSDVNSALMAPFYRGYQENFQLDTDDIAGIQSLYGVKPSTSSSTTTQSTTPTTTTTTTTATSAPTTTTTSAEGDLCSDASIDAIVSHFGNTFVFKGDKFYLLSPEGVATDYPRDLSSVGLPRDLDAAVNLPAQYQYYYYYGRWYRRLVVGERTYFFKGSLCWRFESNGMVAGYPRTISSEFPGIPDNLDAAFVWSGNQRIYFVKGTGYYRYTWGQGTDSGYPRPLSVWAGLPVTIDAAYMAQDGVNYFFKDAEIYRFNNNYFNVETGYPRYTAVELFGCTAQIQVLSDHLGHAGLQAGHAGLQSAPAGGDQYRPEPRDIEPVPDPVLPAESGDLFSQDSVLSLAGDAMAGGQGKLSCTAYTTLLCVLVSKLAGYF